MATGGPFPGVKARPGRDADHPPHLVPRSWMSRSYTSSHPQAPPWCVAGLPVTDGQGTKPAADRSVVVPCAVKHVLRHTASSSWRSPNCPSGETAAEPRTKFTSSPPWDVKSNFLTYLRYVITLVFCLERPKKTLNNDSRLSERDMNPGPPKYKAELLIILYWRRSGQPCDINSSMFHYYRTFSRGGINGLVHE
jgi:hypothetical protein